MIVAEYLIIKLMGNNFQLSITKSLCKQRNQDDNRISVMMTPINNNNNYNNMEMMKTSKIMIAWTNLSLSIQITSSFYSFTKSKSLTIFNAINGSFAVQSLNALMGPSGPSGRWERLLY